ncbi:MAG: DUF4390 domain-containing protein [Hylemonella sp.]
MTAFITHWWKSVRLEQLARALLAWLATGALLCASAQPVSPEIKELRLEHSADSLLLSANIELRLPFAVEDALLKGVPVIFVAEAELLRERWYWADKRVASTVRQMRLSHHPMTRRWRLSLSAGESPASGGALNLSFESLEEALAAISRLSNWRIADWAELEADARHQLQFRFRLDVGQLPRPMQIGTLGQSDWNISASVTQKFVPGEIR